ncbi:MAG: hypothetical protein A2W00_10985 [Candidatus Eisenbacteria bacterium RBG_16_71_46]|nr:MAG: hypothetical protein A2W00_10985 [Candidatus Eisenbacteria bacterium RBG_16_71_46]OGF23072.1 MAG: hypothetical protein A2V63_09430 [Candidatus Eisenbacteria bacterium RBG_19FT_COMBO_70_11]
MPAPPAHPAAFSFDVEDWYHPELLRDRVSAGDPRTVVLEGTGAILDRLRRHRVQATFFVVGHVAARHPDLLRRIADEGHEIACHGMTHRPLWVLDPESFRSELRAFRAAVHGALGSDPVIGYRAPTFSLDRSTAWALAVLRDEGFAYDSSVFPMRVRLYGVPGAPLGIYRPAPDDPARHDPDGPLVEFPVAVADIAGIRLPVGGGFYLRAFPLALLVAALDGIARRRPFALYLHPWECVSGLPRVRLPATDAFITYHRLDTVGPKLDRLLTRYRSVPMREILEHAGHLAPASAA